jgi:hypothetical protein
MPITFRAEQPECPHCPLCKAEVSMPRLMVSWGKAVSRYGWVNVAPTAESILRELIASPHPLSSDELLSRIYQDGGPLSGRRSIMVAIHKANKTLPSIGWRIVNTGRGARVAKSGYFLEATRT